MLKNLLFELIKNQGKTKAIIKMPVGGRMGGKAGYSAGYAGQGNFIY